MGICENMFNHIINYIHIITGKLKCNSNFHTWFTDRLEDSAGYNWCGDCVATDDCDGDGASGGDAGGVAVADDVDW